MNVAFIGMGVMGSRMAANLVKHGHTLSVFNRTPAKATEFGRAHAARVAGSPAEAVAAADVVITMLSDAGALGDVFGGMEGVLAGLKPGTLCIDMSTIGPSDVHDLAEDAQRAGGRFVDAPVSGSVALAESGSLTVMVGGTFEDFRQGTPLFEAMGSRVYHIGALGSGATMKLAVNSIIYGLSEGLSEALVAAERAGISRHLAYDVFANSAIAAPFVHYRRDTFEHPGAVPVAFRLVLAAKDLRLALDLAEGLGLTMAQARVNLAVIDAAISAGFGDHDMSAVAQFLRQRAGEAD